VTSQAPSKFDHRVTSLLADIKALHARLGAEPGSDLAQTIDHLKTSIEELRAEAASLRRESDEIFQSEAALQRERRRYLDLFEQAPDGYIVTSPSGIIQEVNWAACKLLKRPPERLIRKPIYVFFEPDVARSVRTRVQQLAGGADPAYFEAALRLPPNTPIEAEFSVARGFDAITAEVVQLRWRIHEIGSRKAAERELKESRQLLRDLTARLEAVREDERARLAREVHDELGSALTALKMEAVQARRKMSRGDSAGAAANADIISHMADALIDRVRHIASDLRPALLDDFGLVAAVAWLLNDFEARSGIQTELDSSEDVVCPPEYAIVLFRILQELLTNVARHAQAGQVRVQLLQEDGEVILDVRDDGSGIPDMAIQQPTSLGLLGIRERLQQVGGTFEIGREHPKGTWAHITVPLPGAIAS
jgi:PAS domain S-box-containing protein